jgi:ADP-heptose:LPS heptosyltransferase
MGDVAMTVPVVDSVAEEYPETNIFVLTNSRFRDMFPKKDNIIFTGINIKEYNGIFGLLRLYRELTRNQKFDAVIDLHDVLRSKILRAFFRMNNVPVFIINKGRKEKKKLTSSNKKELTPLKSNIHRYSDVFNQAGLSASLTFNGIFKTSSLSQSDQNLEKKEEQWIGVAPFAQHKGKILPLEKTETIIEYFSIRPNTKILLFGGGEYEKGILESWQDKYSSITSLAGKYPLIEELNLLRQCDVLLSMDSANMHLASLVNTPVISVWGATHPFAGFTGFNQNPENMVQSDLPCRPCSVYGNKPCNRKDYACLNQINTTDIISKIETLLLSKKQ